MPQLSRDPLQRTHRPTGCEWLSRCAFGRDGCHRPAGRGVSSPHRSLYSTAVLRGISHPRRASARTPYLQPAASSSGPRTVRDWTPYHFPFLGTDQRTRSAPLSTGTATLPRLTVCTGARVRDPFLGWSAVSWPHESLRTRTESSRHCPAHNLAHRTMMHGPAPRCASPETEMQ